MMYVYISVVFVIGIALGWVLFGSKKTNGTLYIIPQEDRDIYRYEIDDLENLAKYKRISIRVKKIRDENNDCYGN